MADAVCYPYPWQEALWEQLERQAQAQRLPHAVLLAGPAGVGKLAFAQAFLQRILCLSPRLGFACGHCKSCQLLAAGNHPDLHVVAAKEEGKAIGIDPVRELCAHLSQTSQQGGWKAALIAPAEDMTVQAANALLKSLEEPAGNTLIVLVSHEPHRLLPTIRSRCRQLRFAVPPAAQTAPWLRDATGRQDVESLLADAGGRPLLALELCSGEYLEQRSAFNAILDQLARGELAPFNAAEQLASAGLHNLVHSIDWFQTRVVNVVTKLQSDPGYGNAATAELMALHRFYERLLRARSLLVSAANPDKRLLWEQLLLEWARLGSRAGAAILVTTKSPVLSS